MNLSAKDYIIKNICEYQTLFAYQNFEISTMKVLNQLLNVIGNGVSDDEALLKEVTCERKSILHTKENALMYIQQNTKSDNDLPDDDHFKPYPNFHKEYSTIWQCPIFFTLGEDWIRYALKFYRYCRIWLRKYEAQYYYAFPKETSEETKRYLRVCLRQKGSPREYKKNYIRLAENWEKEKVRIFNFIDETIKKLNEELNKYSQKVKK